MRKESYIFILSIIIFCLVLFFGARYVADTRKAAREYKKQYDRERKKTQQLNNKLQSTVARERERNKKNRKYNNELDAVAKETGEDIKKISQIIEEGAERYNRCRCDCGSISGDDNIPGDFPAAEFFKKEVKK